MHARTPFALLALLPVLCGMVSVSASAQAVAARAPVDAERGVLSYSDRIAPILPSVVKVIGRIERQLPPPNNEAEEFTRKYFGSREPSTSMNQGTGFVIDGAAALVVTADFLVDESTSVSVQLHDGREVAASIVGRDAATRIALLRVDATGLNALNWGDSRAARVGDVAFAVGHARSVGKIVTSGIISGFRADSEAIESQNAIASDMVFAPGFAGGPLLDSQGRVLGIAVGVCSIKTFIPISCALPADEAQRAIDRLRASLK